MAKTYEFTIIANTSDVKNKLADLDKSLTKMKADLANTSGEGFEKLTQEIAETEAAIKKLTDAEKKFSDQVEKDTPKNSGRFEKFNEGLIKVGDTIGKIGGGVAAAFSIATGAIGAFGDSLGFSQEEMAEAQQKATSYIAILTGIKPLFEGIVSGIGLIKTAFTTLSAVILANPIGAIITAIGLAIAAVVYWFDEIKEAGVAAAEFIADNWEIVATVIFPIPGLIASAVSYFTDAGDASENITSIALETVNAIKEQSIQSAKTAGSMIGDFNEIYDARRKSLDKEREALDKKYLFERSKAIANGEDYKKLDKEYLESKLKTIQQELDLQLLRFKQVQKLRVEEEGLFDIEAIANQKRKESAEKKLQELQDEFLQVQDALANITESEVQAQEDAYNAFVERKEKERETAEYFRDLEEEERKKDLDFIKALNSQLTAELDAETKRQEERDAALKAKQEADAAEQEAQREKERQSSLEFAQFLVDTEIRSVDERKAALKDLLDTGKIYQDEYAKYSAEIDHAEAVRQQAVTEAQIDLGGQALAALQANLEQGSRASKGIAAAQVLFDTYKAIQSTFANAALNPSSILFPAQPYIQAAIAGAFGFANLRKILAVEPAKASGGSTSSASASSGASSTPAVPSFNLFGQANQGSQQTQATSIESGNQQPQVLRAYVSETDLSQTNNRLSHIRNNAEL